MALQREPLIVLGACAFRVGVLIACYNKPRYGGPEVVLDDLEKDMYITQLWPGTQHLTLPVLTVEDLDGVTERVIALLTEIIDEVRREVRDGDLHEPDEDPRSRPAE